MRIKELLGLALAGFLLVSCGGGDALAKLKALPGEKVGLSADLVHRVVVRGAVVSAVRNPFSSVKKGISSAGQRAHLIVEPVELMLPDADGAGIPLGIEAALDAAGSPAPVGGKVDYLIDGTEFFPELHREVAAARKSVDTRVYIFDNDETSRRYAELLKWKSTEVECRVLFDELGSISSWWEKKKERSPGGGSGEPIDDFLEEGSKVKVRRSLNPWLVTDHSKVFLIDGRLAYLGGMNVGDEYRDEWHDLMARLEGPVVTVLGNGFDLAWNLQGGLGDWTRPFHRGRAYRKEILPGELGIRVLRTAAGVTEIREAVLVAIRNARTRILVHNPYFTSESVERGLIAARKRGVRVTVIFSEENDSEIMRLNNRSVAKNLVAGGVEVRHITGFSHVKAMVADDWVCLGSANLDALSLRINQEVNVAFTDAEKAAELVRRLFRKDIQQGIRLTWPMVRDWGNPVVAELARGL